MSGDAALAVGNYERAIKLTLQGSTSILQPIPSNYSKVRPGKVQWDNALLDVEKGQ